MDCKEVKNLLSDYIDGELSEEEAERIARHLGSCPGCREAYEDMTRLVGFMQEMETIDEPADLVQNVRARLEKSPSLWERLRELFAAPAFRVPAAAAVLAAALLLVLYVPSGRDTESLIPAPTVPTDELYREVAVEKPATPEEPPPVALGDNMAAQEEKPVLAGSDSEGEELAQDARKRSEADEGKKGPAPTWGRIAAEPPARGALEDAPEQAPAEQKTGEPAKVSKGDFAADDVAPKTESVSLVDADIAAANKAAPMPMPVLAFDDTVAIASGAEQQLFAAVDSVGGVITQSFYDEENRLTALEVELPRDRYETFLRRLGTEGDESSVRVFGAVREKEAELRRQATPDVRNIIVRIRVR